MQQSLFQNNILVMLSNLCEEKRGIQQEITYLDEHRVILKYRLPLNEVATDFYDELKSLSSGYASFDYEESGYEPAELVKMDILLNGKAGRCAFYHCSCR